MRDIALLVIMIASVPFVLKRPSLGFVLWVWLSVMNPHRLTYGFAYEMPIAAAAAIITFLGLVVTKEERRLPLTPATIALALFMLWMCITSLVPFHPGTGYDMWSRVMKILLMTFVGLVVIHSKEQIHWVIWITCASLGFYGLKGGIFTVLTGGSYMVWGPAGSFIEGNNEVALALVMIIPLMRYVQLGLQRRWQRNAMTGLMLACALAAIGSHSRGALLAIAAMGGFLWMKSRNKFAMGIVLSAIGVAIIAFMPDEWMTRMNTIKTYDEDASAMGRINAWWMAWNLAKANFFGGGYDIYDLVTFGRYAPNPTDVHAAHSIYFQVLGEHGFVGLILFMLVGFFTWMAASDAKRKARGREDLAWVGPLMDMVKVSMIGYAVGGAFLSLAYFDVPYYVLVIVVATRDLVGRSRAIPTAAARRAPVDHFGAVPIIGDDLVPDAVGAPATTDGGQPSSQTGRPRVDGWRGQAGYLTRRAPVDGR